MKKEKLTVVTTFSGIGMQERGLFNSNVFDVKVIATSDIDKNAILSYAAIHNNLTMDMIEEYDKYPNIEDMIAELIAKNIGYDFTKKKPYDWYRLANRNNGLEIKKYWLAMHLQNNLGDISKVTKLPYADLLTFSFPCTDISSAGLQKGVSYDDWKNSMSTRSGLVWEIVRLLNVAKSNNTLPKYLLLENVAALLSKKFLPEFERLNQMLSDIGYNVYYDIIDGKNTGVPQSRKRVFGIYIRKDVDKYKFTFPKPFDNGLRLKDVIETEVDDRFYLSQEIQDRFIVTDKAFNKNVIGTTKPSYRKIGQRDVVYNIEGQMGCLAASDYKQPKQVLIKETNRCREVGKLNIKGQDCIKRVYSTEGISPTLTTMQGGNRQPKIIKEKANSNELLKTIINNNDIESDITFCDMSLKNPRIIDRSNCISTRYDCGVSKKYMAQGTAVVEKEETDNSYHYYIRKLTPRECFVLMGLTFEDADKCYALGESDSSLYKQAGNGIITNCICLLAEHLYKAQYDESYKCFDEKV